DHDPRLGRELGPALMLAVAYSATIGGLGTIVGTPPNAVFVGAFAQLFPRAPEIGFLQWMMVGVPLVVVLVPLAWFYLVRVATSIGAEKAVTDPELIRARIRELGSMRVPEKRVLLLFCATAALWLTRRELLIGGITVPGWASLLPVPSMVGDSTVAIAMAMILFLVPAGDGSGARLLDWEWAVKLPWGVIVLLGGGFALAEAIKSSGLAVWIGTTLAWVGSSPPLVSILVISLTISLLTEITTNTAITTIMMPILAASAVAAGCDPLLLMVPCALAASLCFMMPSGTAPNAIVFSGGDLSVAFMARTGVGLNLLAVLLVTAVTYLLAVPALGIRVVGLPAWAGGG
ncbi:MAG: SLC13 family permease, partial [Candidatus Binatia bacterium]